MHGQFIDHAVLHFILHFVLIQCFYCVERAYLTEYLPQFTKEKLVMTCQKGMATKIFQIIILCQTFNSEQANTAPTF